MTATVSVSPASGPVGSSLSFTGSGFTPNETVQIYQSGVGSAVLASGTADSSGSISATGHAPHSPYGPRLFVGVGQSSGKLGAANFSTAARLMLNPNSGPVGSTVTAQCDWMAFGTRCAALSGTLCYAEASGTGSTGRGSIALPASTFRHAGFCIPIRRSVSLRPEP